MRRAIIFAIVLSMAVLAPMPVPACALFSPQIAECEAAQTQRQCDGMDMQMDVQDDVSHFSPFCQPTLTCCIVSQIPRPESQYKLAKTLVPVARTRTTADTGSHLFLTESIPVFKWQNLSSPTIQSLLCTFLI